MDLGHQLFRDRSTKLAGAKWIVGDILDPGDEAIRTLDGTVEIVHAASFFHLFGWWEQVAIGMRLVRLFKTRLGRKGRAVTLVGRQLGNRDALEPDVHEAQGLGRYHHNPRTWQKLWDVVGEKTGTTWEVKAEMTDIVLDEEAHARDEKRAALNFVVTRVG
jgi:hypothetical protein